MSAMSDLDVQRQEKTLRLTRMYIVFDEGSKSTYAVAAANATDAISIVQKQMGTEVESAAAMVAPPGSIYRITDAIKED